MVSLKNNNKLGFVFKTLLIFFLASLFLSFFIFLFVSPSGNVALIPVKGTIMVDSYSSVFGEKVASSSEIVRYINDANADSSIKAIVFEINSPGGSAVASKEIVDAIRRVDKPTIAVIREIGASGGYWIASASDHVVANELSITGSIGVLASFIEFAGLLERYNISYERLVAGQYKDMGTSLRSLEDDERLLIQSKLDFMHNFFIDSVAVNRNLSFSDAKTLSTGEFFLGSEAFENGLVDFLGDLSLVDSILFQEYGISDIVYVEYSSAYSFLDVLFGFILDNSFVIGKGIGSSLSSNTHHSSPRLIT